MKTLKSLIKLFMVITFAGLIIVLFNSCENPAVDELDNIDSVSIDETIPWQELLMELDLKSDILFVQEGESIKDVMESAKSGDVIYIEPGNYQEELSLNRSDIKVVGLSLEPDDLFLKNAEINNIEIIKLYNQNGDGTFQDKSINRKNRSILRYMNRSDLGGGIAHYQFEITLGSGEFDVITIHRVVRERRPYKPVRTIGDVFMVHGAIQDFDAVFLNLVEGSNEVIIAVMEAFGGWGLKARIEDLEGIEFK